MQCQNDNILGHIVVVTVTFFFVKLYDNLVFCVVGGLTESISILQIVKGAGHHVYADQSDVFNSLIASLCDKVDSKVQLEEEEAKSIQDNISS